MKYYRILFLLLIFFTASFLVYSRASNAYFLSDDWHWLSSASSQSTIWPNLLTNYAGERTGGSYNPVSSLWINSLYHLFGQQPFAYHAGSIVLHSINAFFIMLLSSLWLLMFSKEKKDARARNEFAVFAGLIFLAWPTSAEAVAWISSVPHLLATLFFLATLILYLYWKNTAQSVYLLWALLTSLLAFFSKESALSLPFVIIFIEAMYQRRTKSFDKKHLFRALYFFVPAALYLIMRIIATGLLFGSYAESSVIVRPVQWLNALLTFFEEMLTVGLMRVPWMLWFWSYPALFGVIGSLIVIAIVALILWHRGSSGLFALWCFVITLLPFITLGFNRITSEGERYTYMPAVFFIIMLASIVYNVRLQTVRPVAVIALLLFSILVNIKAETWNSAGMLSKTIVKRFQDVITEAGHAQEFAIVALPDSLAGAQVFRNNIKEAIAFAYPEFSGTIVQIPVYVRLSRANSSTSVLDWTADERGFFAQSRGYPQVVTGFDRRETALLTFELWGYDYTTFTSETIRLIVPPTTRERMLRGSLKIIAWDADRFRVLSLPQE